MLSAIPPHLLPGNRAPENDPDARALILVVDDTEAQRYAVVRAMRQEGFDVLEASSGEAALALAREAGPDAVILDVELPGMDGFEVCRRLKSDASTFLPVVHLSSRMTSATDRAKGLAVGADGYHTHPFDPQDLRALMHTLVRLKRQVDARLAAASQSTLLQDSLDALGDHVAMLAPDGTILAVNEAWQRFAVENGSVDANAGVGTNYCDVCEQVVVPAAEDTDETDVGHDARAVLTGLRDVLSGSTPEFEHTYACHSPTEERWFRVIVHRLDRDGPIRAIVRHVSVTRQHRMMLDQIALREAAETATRAQFETEARFRGFVETSHEGVLATNKDGVITYANGRAGNLLQRDGRALMGASVFALMTTDSAFALRTSFVNLWGWASAMVEAVFLDSLGRRVEALVALSPIRDVHGELGGAVMMVSDLRAQKETEHALAEALREADLDRRRLHATLEALPVGVWIANATGCLTHTNPAADRIWKGAVPKVASPAEYGVYRAWWPESGAELQAGEWHLARTLATGETYTNELVEIGRFDGTRGFVLNSAAPIHDEDGLLTGGVVVQLDATELQADAAERQRLVAALELERANLTAVFEDAPAYVAVLRGPELVLERFNSRFQRLVEYRAEARASTAGMFSALWGEDVLAQLREVLATGAMVTRVSERTMVTPSPGAPAEPRYLTFVYQRLAAADGAPAVVVHGIDITDEVEATVSARRAETQLREQFKRLPVPTVLWEVQHDDFVLVDLNAAAAAVAPGLAAGQLARDVYPEHDDLRALMFRSLRENTILRTTLDISDVARFEVTVGPQPPDRVLIHAVDMTERIRLEGQLRQAQKMDAVGRLAGGIAHDMNNLLTIIDGHSSFALDQLSPGETARAEIEAIQLAARRAADLTHQLLAFSRKQLLKPVTLDLNASVREAQSMLARLIGEDIEIATRLGAGLPNVLADPGQMSQVIVNLAVNARDAMPDGGQLEIRTDRVSIRETSGVVPPGDYVALAIRDTGIGMDATVLARLFEPFFTTKAPGHGTGLGLATAYGIVKQSGGYITVSSWPGEGTEFVTFLPAVSGPAISEAAVAARERAAQARVESVANATILLVEDEPALRAVTKRLLVRQGYHVLEAEHGDAALRVASAFTSEIHLLLSDAVMPGLPAVEMIARLREARPGMPVLVMSGYTDDEIMRRGIGSATIPSLQKPFPPATLLRAVQDALSRTE